MKKVLFSLFALTLLMLADKNMVAQQLKVGVFDMDVMVQAIPSYRQVDSLVQQYERDSLGAEYEVYQSEYQRLDSTYKADSIQVAAGKKSKTMLDYTAGERQKMAMNIVYWQQIAQNKSNNKRGQLAQPLYSMVANAYKKVLDRKKYTIVLKPNTYEMGFPIDNIFISVAKELKLPGLPQQLLYLGDDPDAGKTAPVSPSPSNTKPKPKN